MTAILPEGMNRSLFGCPAASAALCHRLAAAPVAGNRSEARLRPPGSSVFNVHPGLVLGGADDGSGGKRRLRNVKYYYHLDSIRTSTTPEPLFVPNPDASNAGAYRETRPLLTGILSSRCGDIVSRGGAILAASMTAR